MLIGEAWGEDESRARVPFIGTSGKELWRMMGQAWSGTAGEVWSQATRGFYKTEAWWLGAAEEWLEAQEVGMTNVLNVHPPENRLGELCSQVPASFGGEVLAPLGRAGADFPHGAHLEQGLAERELARLQEELRTCGANLLVPLGNTALWALTGRGNIGTVRGAEAQATVLVPGRKILPTYHPAGVLRQWAWRPIVLADLIKAKRVAEFPEVRRPEREVLVSPTLEEVQAWTAKTLAASPPVLSADIETKSGQITMVSFAAGVDSALVVPFVEGPGLKRYWATRDREISAWRCVQALLESPIPKLGQNFVYDLQYLRRMKIKPRNCVNDLMLLHHGLFPELQKGLGFLGSIYTDEAAWKLMRRNKPDTEKRDE